jgi:hypothetical protein
VSLRVDYLCRGMGWAHAARTAAVLPVLRGRPEIDTVAVAAAGSAVEYFGLVGTPCHDLRLPDDVDHSGYAAYRMRRYLAAASPQRTDRVVVSDELCLAPLLCRADRLPCVLMVCSFRHYMSSHGGARAFDAAEQILLASWPEVDAVPPALRHKVTAIGPIVRATTTDRAAARARLGLPPAGLVVTVSLGSYHPSKVDYFRAVLRMATKAWRHAPAGAPLVVPLPAATARELLDGALPADVRCVGATDRLDTYHLASDVVLSMGGSTTSHAVRNGVPTVVISPAPESREHRVGEYLARRCDYVTVTDTADDDLWARVDHLGRAGRSVPPDLRWGGPRDVLDAVLASQG